MKDLKQLFLPDENRYRVKYYLCSAYKMRYNTLHRIISVVLVTVFLLMVSNRAFYLHSHKLVSGKVIVHAHPFNKSQDNQPFKVHHHSVHELFLLRHVELLFFLGALSLVLLTLVLGRGLSFYVTRNYNTFVCFKKQSRAPPKL